MHGIQNDKDSQRRVRDIREDEGMTFGATASYRGWKKKSLP
jgi:hypothetical protein